MCKGFQVPAGETSVATHYIPHRVQLTLAERGAGSRVAAPLLIPQIAHHRAHVPRGNRLCEQHLTRCGEVVSLAVVQQLVQLLSRQSRQAFPQGCGDVVRGHAHIHSVDPPSLQPWIDSPADALL